ncbi:MAG: hypothetical protein WCH83_00145 [Alphaproteobacteria bacterium]
MQQASATRQRTVDTELEALRGLLVSSEIDGLADLRAELMEVRDALVERDRLETETAQVLASAIRRAERDNPGPLAAAIAPVVVSGIRTEIKNSKEMMVEALYPITGRLVSASVSAAIRDAMETIDRKFHTLTSFEGLKLKLKAMRSGVSVQELILAQSGFATVSRILLIERGSGLLLKTWPASPNNDHDDQLRGSLVAAILEFASQSLSDGSELRALDMGETRIFLRASAQTIIAVEVRGRPRPEFEREINSVLLGLNNQRNMDQEPSVDDLALCAAQINAAEPQAQVPRGRSPARYMVIAALAVLAWYGGTSLLTWWRETTVSTALSDALKADPELKSFPVRAEFDHRAHTVEVVGLLPSREAVDRIVGAVAAAIPGYKTQSAIGVVTLLSASEGLSARINGRLGEQQERFTVQDERLAAQNRQLAAQEQFRLQQDETIAGIEARMIQQDASANARTDNLEKRTEELAAAQRLASERVERSIATIEGQLQSQSRQATERDNRLSAQFDRVAVLESVALSDRSRLERLLGSRVITFDVAMTKIETPEDIAFIQEVSRLMSTNSIQIEVLSIVDQEISSRLNLPLAQQRAQSAVAQLVAGGVAKDRIVSLTINPQNGAYYPGRRIYFRVAPELTRK